MKLQCDVCEKAPATMICCADEAALCDECDVEIHAANKLASKHQRLFLQCLSKNLPPCDICREKAAFIFCVEDRALFCKDCDEPIHLSCNLARNHQRYLATGIRVALNSSCDKEMSEGQIEPKPPKSNPKTTAFAVSSQPVSGFASPSWAVDDLLQFSDCGVFDKKEQVVFSEFEWLADVNLFGESAAAEVPQLSSSQPSNTVAYRSTKFHSAHKKPRIETPDHHDDHFIVPDLG
ncbi:B-box zinc finger protein 24-like [Andrographis paniculata]|uniref:B-box zinc finger protein 24-like n=1 Tax=Andrographis paniculata TaxID=175694 RepID=UPI0021E7C82A|nr:B-box zinc finger protein 24-like [Andrographis paniculata]